MDVGSSPASWGPGGPLKPDRHQEPAPTKEQAGPSQASAPAERPALATGAREQALRRGPDCQGSRGLSLLLSDCKARGALPRVRLLFRLLLGGTGFLARKQCFPLFV